MSARALVIGGGLESLVAASYLARAGFATTVFERRAAPGGTRAPWPSSSDLDAALVFDNAAGVNATVLRELALERHGLRLDAGPNELTAIGRDGHVLTLSSRVASSARAIAMASTRDADAFVRFHATLDKMARALAPILHRTPPTGAPRAPDAWTAWLAGRSYLRMPKRDAMALLRWPPMPVADLVDELFESEPLRALVASRGLFGTFAGPRSAGTTAVLLLRAAAEGGLVPDQPTTTGGARSLVEALVSCARGLKVDVHTRAEVKAISVERGRVTGVVLHDGSHVAGDVVVSGIAPQRTLLELLDPGVLDPHAARRAAHVRARGTIARILLFVSELPPSIQNVLPTRGGTHLLSDVDDLERGFDAMKHGGWREPLWLELDAPHRTNDLAQPVALTVTVHNVPSALRETTWTHARQPLADAALRTLDTYFPGLAARTISRDVLTADDLARELGLPGGHPLHAELALDQLWLARPALGLGGYRSPVGGLYCCGPGVHPGVGPLGTAGRLAARMAVSDRGRSK